MLKTKGFTLIDVIVGTALMLIVFLGIFGAYQLGLKVVTISRVRITATSLANQKLEEARNLPYRNVGIEGVDEDGAIKATEYYPPETNQYTILSSVDCVLDDADGLTPEDSCPCDYKKITVTVTSSVQFGGEVTLSTVIAPKNNIQECEKKGGVLEVSVFDAKGEGLSGIEVQVEEIITGNKKYCLTDLNGKCAGENGIFLNTSLEPENYKVIVPQPGTSPGYSREQTFKSGETYDSRTIANPEKSNPTILEGQITEMSFSVDLLSDFWIETKSSRGKKSFDDEFNDLSKVSDYANISLNEGEVTLAKTNGDYLSSGYLISTDITSPDLQGWDQFSWTDSNPPNTQIVYQVLYFDSQDEIWGLIPDSDLAKNSTGLGPSPVDLSGLDQTVYNLLRVKAALSTTDLSQTPRLSDWHIPYITRLSQPVTTSFVLRGEKIVGIDAAEAPIYKYLPTNQTINKSGSISGLEWDTYNFSNFTISGEEVELEETIPGQILLDGTLSVNLSPNTSQPLTLYLATENTLLVRVKDSESLDPVFSAQVRLYNAGLGYDKTQSTDQNGETFFVPLEEATYSLEVTAEGYENYEGQIWVSGETITTINLILSPS
jgi:type II secretory pathway pseudopilin PulG